MRPLTARRGPRRGPDQARSPERERGFVLIIVLSVIGLLALAAAGFAQITRSQVRAATGTVGSTTAQALADTGVQVAILDLVLARQDPGYRARLQVGDKPYLCDAGDNGRLALAITDEAGKVDLNAADERLLRALLAGVGAVASEAVADAIIDYRDDDNVKRPQGAERDEYSAAGRPGPKNAWFSAVEEIEQVLGIDSDLAARLRPHVTVYTGQPGIDQASASRQLVGILMRGLNNDSGPPPTDSPDANDDPSSMLPKLPFQSAPGRRFFQVHAEAYARSSIFVRDAIIELGQNRAKPYTFLRWRRGAVQFGGAVLNAASLDPCP